MKVKAHDLVVVISPPGTIIPKELTEQQTGLESETVVLAVKKVEQTDDHHTIHGREINLPAALIETDDTPIVAELKKEVGPNETITEDHVLVKHPNHPAVGVVTKPQGQGPQSFSTGLGKSTCSLYILKDHDHILHTKPDFVTEIEG